MDRHNAEVIIKIENVSKMYRLGVIGGTTLREELQRINARIRRKEDPTRKIGYQERDCGNSYTFMALDGIDLTIYKGEAVGIIGHNGAGKSTLLKLLCRITAPTTGTISYDGRIASMLEVGTGFHPELTGRENIYMNGAILGMTKKEIDAKIEDIIEFSECRPFIDTPVKRYSSGMYVKLAFAVAAHLDAEIMIMDEVLAVGDAKFQQKCLKKMRDSATLEGKTVLYVSHNMSTISQMCDRCIVLSHGKVLYDGETEKAIQIYMNEYISETHADYTRYERPPWLYVNDLRIQSVSFVNKVSNLFIDDEPYIIKIVWKNNCDISNLCLRWELCTSDGISVATSLKESFYNGKKGEKETLVFRYEIPELMSGSYTSQFVFYYKIGNGRDQTVDIVPGLSFQKKYFHAECICWNTKYWGYIRIKDPIIVDKQANILTNVINIDG